MRTWFYWVWFFVVSPLWAQSAAMDFAQQLKQIQTMQAHYTQVVQAQSREISRTSGGMALAKPGRFRWSTEKPVAQLIVADGHKIWIYDVDLEQVTIKKQMTETPTGVGLLLNADLKKIESAFVVSMHRNANQSVFELRAKSAHADLKRLLFHFQAKKLVGMELFDTLNQHTIVHFQHIVINQSVPEQQFKFVLPQGIDVVDEGASRD